MWPVLIAIGSFYSAVILALGIGFAVEARRKIEPVIGSKKWCPACREWITLGDCCDEERLDTWNRHQHDHRVSRPLIASILSHPELADFDQNLNYWYEGQF